MKLGSFMFSMLLVFAFIHPYQFVSSANVESATGLNIKQRNPVVNEGKQIKLTALDRNGNQVNDIVWSSGSPDIAQVEPKTGVVSGIKQGFATITAQQGNNSVSVFVVVAKVRSVTGAKVPGDTKADSNGHIYISNPLQNVILSASNTITSSIEIFAGKDKVSGLKNGDRKNSLFAGPTSISIDNTAEGGIYVADTLNHSIRKIDFHNQVETLLGTGAPGLPNFDAEGLANTQSVRLNAPQGVASDNAGNLFIADTDNQAIYYFDRVSKQLALFAGEPGQIGKNDGLGSQAHFQHPTSLNLSSDGKILVVADQYNNRVRVIEVTKDRQGKVTGNVSTLGVAANYTTSNQKELVFDAPSAVGIDGVGNIYVVDNTGVNVVTHPFDNQLQVVALAQPGESFGKASSLYIQNNQTFVLDSQASNEADAIKVVSVGAPEIDSVTPNIININKITPVVVTGKNFAPETVATFGGVSVDIKVVSATEIQFQAPTQIVPGIKTLSLATRGGVAQREVGFLATPANQLNSGQVTTVVGGTIFTGDGGSAINAQVTAINKIKLDSLGNIFISDVTNVRRIDKQNGIITTVAGKGVSTNDNVPATTAMIAPIGLALDGKGNLLIGDKLTSSIRSVSLATGIINTLVTKEQLKPFLESPNVTDNSLSMTFDQNNNLLFTLGNRVLKRDSQSGQLSLVAGTGKVGFLDNVLAINAQLSAPSDVVVDQNNNIYVADTGNNRVRLINNSTSVISTVAGNGDNGQGSQGSLLPPADGQVSTNVTITFPQNITLDVNDNLLIGTFYNGIVGVDLKTGLIKSPKKQQDDTLLPITEIGSKGGLATDGIGAIFFASFGQLNRLEPNQKLIQPIIAGKDVAIEPVIAATLPLTDRFTIDKQDNIYLVNSLRNKITKIDNSTGKISTLLSNNELGFSFLPKEIPVDSKNQLYIFSFSGIMKVDSVTGNLSKVNIKNDNALPKNYGIVGFGIDDKDQMFFNGVSNNTNTIGKLDLKTNKFSVLTTLSSRPAGLFAVAHSGSIYFCDPGENQIRKVDTSSGKVTLYAGKNKSSNDPFSGENGPARQANIGSVQSLGVDQQNNLLIFATANDGTNKVRIWKVNHTNSTISVLTDSQLGYSGDGQSTSKAEIYAQDLMKVNSQGDILFIELFSSIQAGTEEFYGLRLIKH
jgi:streptogramin lyase